jgi:creatinine amidohydrolase
MKLLEMKWPEVERQAPGSVALCPTGALEQHGHHLPLGTDTMIVTHIAEQVEARCRDWVVLLPTLWMGSSHHHLGFAGTVSASAPLFTEMAAQEARCLVQAGFRKIVFLNGHGGNMVPLNQAMHGLSHEYRDLPELWISHSTYWITADLSPRNAPLMETGNVSHACEYETSMILQIRHDLVDMSKARGERAEQFNSAYVFQQDEAPSRVSVARPFQTWTGTGAMGQPQLATAEKGAQLLDVATGAVVEFLTEFRSWKPGVSLRPKEG